MNCLLSVVIPTKNRYKYLKESLLSLWNIVDDNVEIIIQDNTELNDEIISFLRENPEPHTKYYHCENKLSQTENSSLAIQHSNGEYVCFIGDDDLITTELIHIVEYMSKNSVLACVCDVASYYWPDVKFIGKRKPTLSYKMESRRIVNLDAQKLIKKMLKESALDITLMARVYHGIVHKSLLETIFEKTGTYFPGPSPDMANAVATTLLLDSYIYVNAPLIVSGVGYNSGAGMGQRGEHKGELSDAKQLPQNVEEKWNERIPKLWIGYTMWAESATEALIEMGYGELANKMNYIAMDARTILRFSEYRKIVLKNADSPMYYIKLGKEFLLCGCLLAKRKMNRFKLKRNKELFETYEPLTIEEALKCVEQENMKHK